MTADPTLRTVKAWPFEEAAKVADRVAASGKGEALFQTGYGPSGLPHIGTFGEVARTTWVRRAFGRITGLPSRLLAFSDDMDGLRKVPDNVPNKAMLEGFLGRPLTAIPDPFGTHDSFGAHNNARLRAFLDTFGFDYEFASSTDYYRSGRFDAALRRMLEVHEQVRAVILPTLGPERRATYSPFLPIHPRTGVVMQVPMEETRPDSGTLVWRDPETGERFETPVTGGHCKAQWKADWALRWYALGVDYEMSGKDLIDSVRLSGQICRVLGGQPPVGFTYELFLDEQGQKISKSKGNGLTIEEWLRYAPPESLAQFMYGAPQRAKRLFFDVIPRAVDDYLANLEKLRAAPEPTNPAWYIHDGEAPDEPGSPASFSMLLNLVSAAGIDDPLKLLQYFGNYIKRDLATGSERSSERVRKFQEWSLNRLEAITIKPNRDLDTGIEIARPDKALMFERLCKHAVAYYSDFVEPQKRHRAPTVLERAALEDLLHALRALPADADAETIQTLLYDIGKRHAFPNLRDWFGCLYQVLLGQQEGPRFGGFVALYGIPGTIGLIEAALAREASA
ncbi:lysine--tRNA ligase [Siccirubricoccus sp. G192]|uniref:lysine--tRNA ligase n=1 Tax=Siccirubricoccus sp. G192 TaxID=2849651 RepID=UPI001C2B77A7|nr:lysine--tRNA ligase [Siccirubricoccus sp. G192]MBV1797240.1 lysine--tRNA ligase [Siccirubricoccus sp. G192]